MRHSAIQYDVRHHVELRRWAWVSLDVSSSRANFLAKTRLKSGSRSSFDLTSLHPRPPAQCRQSSEKVFTAWNISSRLACG